MKGHSSGSSGGGNNMRARGRQYAMMLLLASGAAILGVMVLHKLRERRIFSLLLKEKDHQLISLHHLLQKERGHNKEAKRKIEEMKAKVYSARAQKMELDRRILEMQSTISSLKDEQKTMESALEEKQTEIRFLREEAERNQENPQPTALTKTLEQKESETLNNPSKIWSSTADPSNSAANLTNGRDDRVETKGNFNYQVQGDGDEVEGKRNPGFRDGEILPINEEKMNPNMTEADMEGKARNSDMKNQKLQGNEEARQLEMNTGGGVKLETQEDSSGNGGREKERVERLKQHRRLRGGINGGNGDLITHNGRSRYDGRQRDRYKRISNDELQKLTRNHGDYGTEKNELDWGNEMMKFGKTGVNEQNGKGVGVDLLNEHVEEDKNRTDDVLSNATASDGNHKNSGKLEISEELEDGVQRQVETDESENVDPRAKDMGHTDYAESKIEQEEDKEGEKDA